MQTEIERVAAVNRDRDQARRNELVLPRRLEQNRIRSSTVREK
jgi:hypothetical protein